MRPKSLVLLILALGCGLVASIGISEIIDSNSLDEASVDKEAILVASADIERSAVLTPQNLILKEWPKDTIPGDVVRNIEEVEGRRPVIRISAGMPILQSMLGSGDGSRPDEQIPKGYRVATVKVSIEDGAKLIRPGGRVDVQVYVRQNNSSNQSGIRTFLKDISVFAVDADIGTDEATGKQVEARSVALLVTPEQASKVTLATEIGKVRLVLRGSQDDLPSVDAPISIKDLFGESETGGEGSAAIDELREKMARLENENQSLRDGANNGNAPVDQPTGEPLQMVVIRGFEPSVVLFRPDGQYLETVGGKEPQGGLKDWVGDGSKVSTMKDGSKVSTTKDGSKVSTTKDGSKDSTTKDGADKQSGDDNEPTVEHEDDG